MVPAPVVSVVTATYNWSSVLRYAIASVQAQEFAAWEMVIVGDACTDDTEALVRSMHDGRLRWFNREENSGSQGLPNNDGIALARGRYVAYLGHDDLWHPSHLAALVSRAEETGADLIYAPAMWIGPPENPIRMVTGFMPPAGHQRFLDVPPSSVMHRRELAAAVGGWRDHRTISEYPDRDFIGRIWQHSGNFAATEEFTVFKFPSAWREMSYRDRPSQIQADYLRRMSEDSKFMHDEMLATIAAIGQRAPGGPNRGLPGRGVAHLRSLRGLAPQALPPAPLSYRARHFMRRLGRPAKRLAIRLLRRLEEV